MSRDRLQIFFRRRQLENEDGPVVVQCNADNFAEYVPGVVDQTWINVTDQTTGLDKLSLAWDKVNSGTSSASTETNPGGSNYDKGVSVDLTFNDEAYQFIYNWLLSDPCGILNAVEVKITDELCERDYRTFEIKADNLSYAPFDAPCEFEIKLREADPVWHCVHKTFIWDNWQNWFIDGSSKDHPCFLTGIEPRPRLVNSARMGLSIFGQTIPVISIFFNETGDVFRRILNVDNFVDAPLVRDYISNVAGKCGIAVDTIFHDPSSPYYNLCLYFPSSGAMHVNDDASVLSPALWFHFENRWNITLAELLDKLKVTFNAEWYVTPNNTLVFKPVPDFLDAAPIYDFSAPGALPIWELRYTFNGDKKPAYGRYEYTIDASDLASQEIRPLYNDIVDYDGDTNNLMLEGSSSKVFEWASTGFVRDGRARGDYLRDIINDGETVAYALVILLGVIVAALIAGVASAGAGAALAAFLGVWAANIASKANDLRTDFGDAKYTGAVRLTSEQTAQPRLLLWDGEDLDRAKVVKVDPDDIVPNTFYNSDAESYQDHNVTQYNPVGGLFVFNYDLYFDSFFEDNMFDRFHETTDNPLKSLQTHQTFEFYTDLCCEMLETLGAFDGQFARIGAMLKIEQRDGYEVLGRIEHYEINYDDERIILRGKVFKVKTVAS